MTSATKILGVGLLAVVAGCAADNAIDKGTTCNTRCPVGSFQSESKTASGDCSASGNQTSGKSESAGRCIGTGECAIFCAPPNPCCEGEKWTTTSYECAKACTSEDTEGPEGTPPEGEEGDAEGSEGTEGSAEGPEGKPEGVEGDAGNEGPEGSAEGPEGEPEGVEGDAGTEGPEGGACTPDCIGKTCGDDGCGGECGSCDKLPEPVCVDEKTSLTYPEQDVPGTCGADGKCKWDTKEVKCEGFDTCIEGECDCVPLAQEAACANRNCGPVDDGCGAKITCAPNQCVVPDTCGGGGTPNVCGCMPQCAGKSCGDDGCGGDCGTCTAPETCGGGGKPGECGAPGGTVYWAKGFGEAGVDVARSVAVDEAGNIVVAGTYQGTVDFGGGALTSAGGNDIFVAKYDATGAHVWSKRFGDSGEEDRERAIAVDGVGNVVITGMFGGTVDFGGGPLTSAGPEDIFVAKYDALGAHLWSHRFGGSGHDEGGAVAVDGTGNVVVTGIFDGTADFGGGPLTSAGAYDVFVAKYDDSGAHLWSKRFGGPDHQWGSGVAVNGEGDVVVTGLLADTVDFGGGPLTSAGDYDVFVAKYDATGAHVWSKRFGGTSPDYGNSVAVDDTGNVVVTGFFQGTMDFGGGGLASAGVTDIFVAGYDTGGAHLWSKRFGGVGEDEGASVAVDGSGNVVVTGYFAYEADFGGGGLVAFSSHDIFVAKYDAAGKHVWSQRFGGISVDDGNSVAVDSAGNVFVTGFFRDTVDFGGVPLTSAGETDIFLLKLAK